MNRLVSKKRYQSFSLYLGDNKENNRQRIGRQKGVGKQEIGGKRSRTVKNRGQRKVKVGRKIVGGEVGKVDKGMVRNRGEQVGR